MSVRRDQLTLQMDRLIETFGDKPFSSQREHLIWEIVDGLTYDQVIRMVDEFIGSSAKPPLPSDFAAAAKLFSREKKRYALGEFQPLETAGCKDCADSGFVHVLRKDAHEPWAKWWTASICCHCERGRLAQDAAMRMKSPTEIARFNDAWLTSYTIDRDIVQGPAKSRQPPKPEGPA